MNPTVRRYTNFALLAIVVVLTLATGYIHYWVGGMMLMLNAAGYLALALTVVGAAAFFRRGLPLVLMALAAYAAVTIVGWLIMGPYFDVAYLAKGIEILLIGTIAVWLLLNRQETVDSVQWGRSLADRFLRTLLRRPASDERLTSVDNE